MISLCSNSWISIFEGIHFLFRLIYTICHYLVFHVKQPNKQLLQMLWAIWGSRFVDIKYIPVICTPSWGSPRPCAVLPSGQKVLLWLRNCASLSNPPTHFLYLLIWKHSLLHERGQHIFPREVPSRSGRRCYFPNIFLFCCSVHWTFVRTWRVAVLVTALFLLKDY